MQSTVQCTALVGRLVSGTPVGYMADVCVRGGCLVVRQRVAGGYVGVMQMAGCVVKVMECGLVITKGGCGVVVQTESKFELARVLIRIAGMGSSVGGVRLGGGIGVFGGCTVFGGRYVLTREKVNVMVWEHVVCEWPVLRDMLCVRAALEGLKGRPFVLEMRYASCDERYAIIVTERLAFWSLRVYVEERGCMNVDQVRMLAAQICVAVLRGGREIVKGVDIDGIGVDARGWIRITRFGGTWDEALVGCVKECEKAGRRKRRRRRRSDASWGSGRRRLSGLVKRGVCVSEVGEEVAQGWVEESEGVLDALVRLGRVLCYVSGKGCESLDGSLKEFVTALLMARDEGYVKRFTCVEQVMRHAFMEPVKWARIERREGRSSLKSRPCTANPAVEMPVLTAGSAAKTDFVVGWTFHGGDRKRFRWI